MSGLALVLAGYAALRPVSGVDQGALSPEVQKLQAQVASLERSVAAAKRTAPAPLSAITPAAQPQDLAPAVADEPMRYTDFKVAEPGVTVVQAESGGLEVSNTNPELTGQTLVVRATASDGSGHQLTVTVPPPPG